uniref:TAFII55_N domain-containing protein n=1 Tax=Steinernema glaseri TaxID=37863 RepID=A0A1I7Y809_9BILA
MSSIPIPRRAQKAQETGEEDWENHLIIRFPEDVAPKVAKMIADSGGEAPIGQLHQKLEINMQPEIRNGTVRFDGQLMSAKVYDLPCLNEVVKTIDNKNVYKVADLSQIIICSHDTEDQFEIAPVQKEPVVPVQGVDSSRKKEKQFQYPHGLTPPMKNARKRRFRKTKKKKYVDVPDLDRELKRLLRSDMEAKTVKWEVINTEEETNNNAEKKPIAPIPSSQSNVSLDIEAEQSAAETSDLKEEDAEADEEQETNIYHDLLGALSSSSEEETEADDIEKL